MNTNRLPTATGAKRTHGWCRFHRSSNTHDSADCRDVHEHQKRRGWVYEPYHQPEIDAARRRAVVWEHQRENEEFAAKSKNASWKTPVSSNMENNAAKKKKTVTFGHPICTEEHLYLDRKEWNPDRHTPASSPNAVQSEGRQVWEHVPPVRRRAGMNKYLQVARDVIGGQGSNDRNENGDGRNRQDSDLLGTNVRESIGEEEDIFRAPIQEQQSGPPSERLGVQTRFHHHKQALEGISEPELVDDESPSTPADDPGLSIPAAVTTTAIPTAHGILFEATVHAQTAILRSADADDKTQKALDQSAFPSSALKRDEPCAPVEYLTAANCSTVKPGSNPSARQGAKNVLITRSDGQSRQDPGHQCLPSTSCEMSQGAAPTTLVQPVNIEIGPTAEGPVAVDLRHPPQTPVIFSLNLIPGMEVTFQLPGGEIHVTHRGVDPVPGVGTTTSTASNMVTATGIIATDEAHPVWASHGQPVNTMKQLKAFFQWFAQRRQQTTNLNDRSCDMDVFTSVRGTLASQGVTVQGISEMIGNSWRLMGVETELGPDIAKAAGRYAKLRKLGMDI